MKDGVIAATIRTTCCGAKVARIEDVLKSVRSRLLEIAETIEDSQMELGIVTVELRYEVKD
jgi:hypothetical protein